MMECALCQKSFSTKSNLRRHNETIHSTVGARFECDICGIKIKRKDVLLDHVRKHTNTDISFECNDCEAKFQWKRNLLAHTRVCRQNTSNSTPSIFECTQCQKSFSTKSILRRHNQTVHSTVAARFECEICGIKIKRKDDFLVHTKKHTDLDSLFECDDCGAKFQWKRNLLVHTRVCRERKSNSTAPLAECTVCKKSFSTKSCLRRHNRTFHATVAAHFECDVCGVVCNRKDVLLRHIRKHKPELNDSFECNDCGAKFGYKNELAIHIRRKHQPSSSIRTEFECTQCRQSFSAKQSLLRHNRTAHSTVDVCFECETCGIKCIRKDALLRHMKNHESESNASFECNDCEAKYTQKWNLLMHIFEKHKSDSAVSVFECDECNAQFYQKDDFLVHVRRKCKESKYICAMCRKSFVNARQVNAHYNTSHGIAFQLTNLEFETFDKFQEWKRGVEREDITYFAKERGSRVTSKSTLIQYICHRSGTYKDKSAGRRRKRFLKLSGSKKLQAHCPAKMRAKVDAVSGVCKVLYQQTHCGHNVKDANELCHVYLTKDDKAELAPHIEAGVPITRLKKQLYLSAAGTAKAERLSWANLEADDDERNVNEWVERSTESVLYYKARGADDTKYGTLERNDFAVVLMDEEQAANIRAYGHKVICFDSTYDTNPYGFVLHTMMVLNLWCESVPVAFLVANKNDKSVVDVFLRCVHERLGVVRTKVFMSDMQQTYLNSWIEVMGHFPEYCLYCPWHVHEAWRRNYAKITNKETRVAVIKRLNELAVELDPVRFETALSDFLGENDPHAAKFLRYFVKNFTENIPCWAFCYRHNLGLYTNVHLELFYRVLRRNVADGSKVKTLTQCLQQLQEYLTARANEDQLLKGVRSQTTYKLRVLRQKHHRAADYLEKTPVHVESIDSNTFLVQSFAESHDDDGPKMYTVTKRKSKECRELGVTCLLVCDACKICFHEFYCDCLDSGIKSNMCKHIHAIGITNCAAEAKVGESAAAAAELTTTTIVKLASDEEMSIDETKLWEPMIKEESELEIDAVDSGTNLIEEMLEPVRDPLSSSDSLEDVYELRGSFAKPMLEARKKRN